MASLIKTIDFFEKILKTRFLKNLIIIFYLKKLIEFDLNISLTTLFVFDLSVGTWL